MRNRFFLATLLIISCAQKQEAGKEDPIKIATPYDYEGVQWFKGKGNGNIRGRAQFRSKHGDIRFGKGFRIELMPYCHYTEERLSIIYGDEKAGYVFLEEGIPQFTPDPEGYHDTKKAICNAYGEFEFKDLPSGDYYLVAFMLWDGTGGGIMRKVTLSEGESKFIAMLNY